MSLFRSTYGAETKMLVSVHGVSKVLVCAPGGTGEVPDACDRLVPRLCPGWVKAKAEAAPEPETKAAEPQKQHQGQSHKGGQR